MTPVSWLTGKEPTCKFCNDKGCIACPGEQYKASLDKDGNPIPFFVAHRDNPSEMNTIRLFLASLGMGEGDIETVVNMSNVDNTGEERGGC